MKPGCQIVIVTPISASTAEDRVLEPMIKFDGKWQGVSWDEGMRAASEALRSAVVVHGSANLGVLMSPSAFDRRIFPCPASGCAGLIVRILIIVCASRISVMTMLHVGKGLLHFSTPMTAYR